MTARSVVEDDEADMGALGGRADLEGHARGPIGAGGEGRGRRGDERRAERAHAGDGEIAAAGAR